MQDIACFNKRMCATVCIFSSVSFHQVFWKKPFKHTEIHSNIVSSSFQIIVTAILFAKAYCNNIWSLNIPVTFRYYSCFQAASKYFKDGRKNCQRESNILKDKGDYVWASKFRVTWQALSATFAVMVQAAPRFTRSRLEVQQNQFILQAVIWEDLGLNSLTSVLELNLVCLSFTLELCVCLFVFLIGIIHSFIHSLTTYYL